MSSGYVVPNDADAYAASAIMDDADATTEEFTTALAGKLKTDIPPIAEFDAARTCRETGPRSPCNELVLVVIVLVI